ncbi:7TM diverse intracellular signaling domain-containing protein [Variovorax sp. VNK109]|uniref:sensor histidine kinase n=1 Tax=Variovorax sp. VNK109 TaxID=3400919 RepID=UPI003C10AA71
MQPVARACFRDDACMTVLRRLRARMPSLLLRASVVLSLFVLLAPGAWAQVALHITTAQFQVTPDGTFGPAPPLPRLDASRWQPTALPAALPRAIVPPTSTEPIDTVWFRIELPAGISQVPPGTLRLYVPRWQTVGQVAVYADERLVYRSGAGPVWNGFNHPLWLRIDAEDGTHPQTLLVRLDHSRSVGAALSTAWVGDSGGLGASRWWRQALQVGLPLTSGATALMLGFFSLIVWFMRRESPYGLFFLISLVFFIRTLHYHLGIEPLPISEEWFGWMTLHSLSLIAVLTNIFGLRLHNKRYPVAEWSCLGIVFLSMLVSLPPLAALTIPQIASIAYLVLLVVFTVMTVLCLWSAWRARSSETLLVMLFNALAVPASIHDLLLLNYQLDIEHIYLLPLEGVTLLGSLVYVVVRRYVNAVKRAEVAQSQLERELRAREEELMRSHERLREVEHREILHAERQRLMQDMHDGLGASLMGALKAAENGQPHDMAEVLRQCLDDLKLTIDSLEQVEPDLLLLLATLRYRLGARLQQAGVDLVWEVADVPPLNWLEPRSALHILRILQEVFVNIAKHSGANTITLRTAWDAFHVSVSVADDGIGFDTASPPCGGRGMANIARRADALGAHAHWQSGEANRVGGGKGTYFVLILPRESRLPQPASEPPSIPA